jgi:hypothetical protein
MTDHVREVPNEKTANLAEKRVFSLVGMVNSPGATLPQMGIHFLFMETDRCGA